MNARKLLSAALVAAAGLAATGGAQAQSQDASGKKPNILVIFGDDIGQTNISAYGEGVVGYETPNIDRIAKEGVKFTDYYGENSCTAGRSSFITGQSPLRTGLTKVGAPGASVGLQKGDITIAEALKAQGYVTAQFGKNHLGDKDEYLPTRHGFDEFFGNLYHLNAEEEPERPYWPKDSNDPFVKNFSPRGVVKASADGKVEDTGALTRKRMETIDDETVGAALDYIDKHGKGDKPFFVWMNTTRMHVYTHVRPENKGKSGMPGNDYADGMLEHDEDVGKLLKKLDDLGIADNTIVVYTTDNGPNQWSWPDAATTPFRSEKDSNWEGAFRVPAMVRWPGKIPAGQIKRGIVSGMDWFPTLLAAAGDTSIKDRLLKGWTPPGNPTNFKVHLDGYNQLDYLTGKSDKSARNDFYYFNDDGILVSMRYDDWKVVFCEQRAPGNLNIWQEPFVCLRVPKVFNLRMDPYERADITSDQYNDWLGKNAYLTEIGTMKATAFMETFVTYPPSQRPASFSIDQVQERVHKSIADHFKAQDKKEAK
ncbi:arylsulfatase [Achromobacter pulmonis]|uniref:Arylsulfatase n=1 Tax=Achromobacter pulmonis TaxID=1389932 RepID=A0A2N8KP95_9BURK|nr:arylsulfatase [Achromobacter pulmonis]MBO9329314.1 sulfatase-like hydrolase/transferase [Achromobacter xylosoxidans]PND35250.1 arylsulfatase [Achromobacter pulmonis]